MSHENVFHAEKHCNDAIHNPSRAGTSHTDREIQAAADLIGRDAVVVTATRDVRAGEEVLVSYGERCDRHFFLFFGFLPAPNPHNTVALFANAREAAAWYEALCDDGECT